MALVHVMHINGELVECDFIFSSSRIAEVFACYESKRRSFACIEPYLCHEYRATERGIWKFSSFSHVFWNWLTTFSFTENDKFHFLFQKYPVKDIENVTFGSSLSNAKGIGGFLGLVMKPTKPVFQKPLLTNTWKLCYVIFVMFSISHGTFMCYL